MMLAARVKKTSDAKLHSARNSIQPSSSFQTALAFLVNAGTVALHGRKHNRAKIQIVP